MEDGKPCDVGPTSAQRWPNVGSMSAQRWPNVGLMSAQCRPNVGSFAYVLNIHEIGQILLFHKTINCSNYHNCIGVIFLIVTKMNRKDPNLGENNDH